MLKIFQRHYVATIAAPHCLEALQPVEREQSRSVQISLGVFSILDLDDVYVALLSFESPAELRLKRAKDGRVLAPSRPSLGWSPNRNLAPLIGVDNPLPISKCPRSPLRGSVIPLNTARPHVLTRRLDREVGQPLENRSLRYLDWPRDFLCHKNA